ncbi:MAG: NTP transferase domain-containing protein [Paludibacteraceae bacterium]|nr:NTP transferase domain-containing protein [Paludibacteraceae bacterium]
MKAMIFAAGLGTRLKPLTDTMPKALVPLAGKPLLQWQVEKLAAAGIKDITVNVHHFADMIIDEVQKNNGWGADITISDEREMLLDTGGGVRKVVNAQCTMHDGASEHSGNEPLLLCNVDILSNIAINKVVDAASRLSEQESLLVVSERATQRYLCFNEQEHLCGWTNIATGELKGQDGRHLAYSGIAVLKPSLWPYLNTVAHEKGDKFGLMDLYLHIVAQRAQSRSADSVPVLRAYIPKAYKMMDVGKIEQIETAEQFAREMTNV